MVGLRPLMLEVDCECDASLSLTWSFGPDGSLHHRPTDTKVSTDRGITFEGHEYRLSPEDIGICNTPVGSGCGGFVQKGVVKGGGSTVAVKTVRMDDKAKRDQLLSELKGLTQAEGNEFLVQWYAAFASKRANAVHIVLEFMDLGSLGDLRNRLGSDGVPALHLSCAAMQMTHGLDHLHGRRIIHRDIKPQNVLHNCIGQVKLTDFGISKSLDSWKTRTMSVVGTQAYMSPERCRGDEYSFNSDVWSLGMVIYEMASAVHPFADVASVIALFDALCQQPEPRLDPLQFLPSLCHFVERCLTRDISARPEASELSLHDFVTLDCGSLDEFAMWLATLPST
eukprot:TRINITY_DN111989_c0_g1_i1.p1 TRINITY_DN111989_c0_g1~~TRINITY_DN111989_c0_g1_i1.p1  ORF type:complete len:339 (+),score=38.02 TRINITY_DN111989_c0_g1_i1:73-1089(+)